MVRSRLVNHFKQKKEPMKTGHFVRETETTGHFVRETETTGHFVRETEAFTQSF